MKEILFVQYKFFECIALGESNNYRIVLIVDAVLSSLLPALIFTIETIRVDIRLNIYMNFVS